MHAAALVGASMTRVILGIAFAALSITVSASGKSAGVSLQCAKQPGLIDGPIVATADTARRIYISIAKQRGDQIAPENNILVNDNGDQWSIFQHAKRPEVSKTSNGETIVSITSGGSMLEMEIDKCSGTIRAHYSR
jgi:hypothetical protein